jgi:hypothetical protein
MDQHDLHRSASAETAEQATHMGPSLRAEGRGAPAVGWECYSLDILAAILDFDGIASADW